MIHCKDRLTDQWDRTESRNKTMHICSNNFQSYKDNSLGETIVFSTNGAGTNNWILKKTEKELRSLSHTYTKFYSK